MAPPAARGVRLGEGVPWICTGSAWTEGRRMVRSGVSFSGAEVMTMRLPSISRARASRMSCAPLVLQCACNLCAQSMNLCLPAFLAIACAHAGTLPPRSVCDMTVTRTPPPSGRRCTMYAESTVVARTGWAAADAGAEASAERCEEDDADEDVEACGKKPSSAACDIRDGESELGPEAGGEKAAARASRSSELRPSEGERMTMAKPPPGCCKRMRKRSCTTSRSLNPRGAGIRQ
mmetsp:Transcript_9766/g.24319  ORF Transcript_9766/g.24319 Transcript_9766/m.24319 type:complete len:234 (-) Transcript_9766:692-1393(-)